MFIQAIQDQDEILCLHEESQDRSRRGDEIAYKLCREGDWSSPLVTHGLLEASFSGNFSSNRGVLCVDFHWEKSVLNSLTPMDGHDRPLFNELHW